MTDAAIDYAKGLELLEKFEDEDFAAFYESLGLSAILAKHWDSCTDKEFITAVSKLPTEHRIMALEVRIADLRRNLWNLQNPSNDE